jgi:hypothetical protein
VSAAAQKKAILNAVVFITDGAVEDGCCSSTRLKEKDKLAAELENFLVPGEEGGAGCSGVVHAVTKTARISVTVAFFYLERMNESCRHKLRRQDSNVSVAFAARAPAKP